MVSALAWMECFMVTHYLVKLSEYETCLRLDLCMELWIEVINVM